jgi:hypothetical protein
LAPLCVCGKKAIEVSLARSQPSHQTGSGMEPSFSNPSGCDTDTTRPSHTWLPVLLHRWGRDGGRGGNNRRG